MAYSPQVNYTDHRLSVKLVPTLAERGYRVVSTTNPHIRDLYTGINTFKRGYNLEVT
jgi:hypothetical protein